MGLQTKEIVLGDVVKWELPHEYCREMKNLSRDLGAVVGLACGEIMEADADIAQIHTVTEAVTIDGGTYRLGYKGQWTTNIPYGDSAANMKTAFDLLSTVIATGDAVTFSAPLADAVTCTWGIAGQKAEIEIDARLLLDGTTVLEGAVVIAVSTIGSTVAEVVIAEGTADATCILLEKVTLADILSKNDIERAVLLRGPAIVDSDQVTVDSAEKSDALIALRVLGIQFRTEPTIYQSGPVGA